MITNWSKILNGTETQDTVYDFATGKLCAKNTAKSLAGTGGGGEFRTLVRKRGTNEARILARKALRRRGYTI